MKKYLKVVIRKNQYHDSVRLMNISKKVSELKGIVSCIVLLGTEGNKKIIKDLGLSGDAVRSATPNDLLISIETTDSMGWDKALEEVDSLLGKMDGGTVPEAKVSTLLQGSDTLDGANVALISIPGEYARPEVTDALEQGLHVMLFSDNVSLEDEIFLKKLAVKKGLLLMGPDCGTSIINGTGLAFFNQVRRGNTGIVGASGTGIQEVTSLIDRLGGGVSHAIGVGGRDLKKGVDGMMMVSAIQKLARDKNTKSLVLISKPGNQKAMKRVTLEAKKPGLPVVVCFLGREKILGNWRGVTVVSTLEEAAYASVKKKKLPPRFSRKLLEEATGLSRKRKFLRGLYSGGTLCYEALLLLDGRLDVHSNTPLRVKRSIRVSAKSKRHYCIDMGADEFTRGRPHPMIDSTLRKEWIVEAYNDPDTGVILLDVMLGYGAHMDPAGDVISAIDFARAKSREKNGFPLVLAHVCGTESDPQSLNEQERKLKEAGVHVFETNADAVRAAEKIIKAKIKQ